MNIEWKYIFTNTILKRGQEYYRNGAVHSKDRLSGPQTKAFSVIGSEVYTVTITRDKKSFKSMQCNCPYARRGTHCKHMAAALFQMEHDGDLEVGITKFAGQTKAKPAKPVRVFPFKEGNSAPGQERPYNFYRFDKITEDILFYSDDVETAKKLIEMQRVCLESVEEGFYQEDYGEPERKCVVWGSYTDAHGHKHDIRIYFERESLISAYCNVPTCPESKKGFSYYYGYSAPRKMCAHLTALFLLAQEYIASHRIGDATDYTALKLMNACRNESSMHRRISLAEGNKSRQIRLEPRLDVEGNGRLYATFRVGEEKLYIIKDLTEFVQTVEQHREMKLSSKAAISFAEAELSEDSQELYNFIKNEVKSADVLSSEIYWKLHQHYGEIKSAIPLYGRTLDEFYEMMEGREFPYTQRKDREKITGVATCDTQSPQIRLFVEPFADSDGNFDGIEIEGEIPALIEGATDKYFFDEGRLNRAVAKDSGVLQSLMQANDYGRIDFKVGRRNLSEFYHNILPALDEIAEVQIHDASTIEKYLYPAPEFSFFLDADENVFFCDVKVRYGDNTCDLTRKNLNSEQSAAGNGNEIYEDYRNIRMERVMLSMAKELFPEQNEEGTLFCADEEQQYKILESGVDALLQLGEVHATDRFQRTTIRKKPQITVGVRMESDLLKLKISSTDLTDDELIDILNSYRNAKKYHRLRNGDFVQIEEKTLEELSVLMKLSKAAPRDFVKGDMEVPAYRALYLDKVLEKNEKFYARRDRAFKHLIKEFKTVEDSEYEVPESLQTVMRGYQGFGYKWLRTIENYRFGGILADDMGLGKTLQMISVLLAAKQEGRLGEALIVTPASLVYNWKEEFAKFAPELSVAIVAGGKEEREAQIQNREKADVLITSYDLLKRDILYYADKTFSYQIIDEAQYIKTHTTAAAKSVKAVNSKIRFALTGTPIENRLSELWSIFDFLMPGFLYGYEQFRKEMELPIVKHNDKDAMSRLKRLVEPFILRRLKQDVLKDLPEKNEEICYVHFGKKQQNLYDGQALHMKQILEGQSDEMFQKNKIAILAEITKIRQICCDPSLCFDNYDGESAKRETCMELLKSAIDGGHKILVFSQFRSLLEMLENDLRAENISYFKITGETPKEERLEMVNRFNKDETPVFLISLKAGGTGLNLTGADIVIHFDPWWNLAAQNQATDRAHRIGQTKAVSVYKLIAKDSIEEKILKMQEEKSALADEILSGNAGGLMSMSRAEILQLL